MGKLGGSEISGGSEWESWEGVKSGVGVSWKADVSQLLAVCGVCPVVSSLRLLCSWHAL